MTVLTGKLIALSISDAPDRARLGFPAREVDRAMFSICTVLVRAGAKIVYAGNLDPDGRTFSMFRHLSSAYADGKPFIHMLPLPILRSTSFEDLVSTLRQTAVVAETRLQVGNTSFALRASDDVVRIREEREKSAAASKATLANERELAAWLSAFEAMDDQTAYSETRKAVSKSTNAQVLLGGKMGLTDHPSDSYAGAMPGIIEEAAFALQSGNPCIPLGAFGGATRDVAIALDLLPPSSRVPRGEQLTAYEASLKAIAALRNQIPDHLRPALSALADDDRGEPMAYDVARVLAEWLS